MVPQRNDRVLLELFNREVFEGTINRLTASEMELIDVYYPSNDIHYQGSMTFFFNEVATTKIIKSKTKQNSTASKSEPLTNGCSEKNSEILFGESEYNRLYQMALNHIFIDMHGTSFNEAVANLKNKDCIGVLGIGNMYNRKNPLSLLIISDSKQIFIFDMLSLKDLNKDLKEILQDENVTKVVYAGEFLNDKLLYVYNTKMSNVFDINISEKILEPHLNHSTIAESCGHHFNLPMSLFDATKDELHQRALLRRPLIKQDKCQAALLSTYLIALKNHLFQKILQKHTEGVQQKYIQIENMSDLDLMKLQVKTVRKV